jgi:hypothetical protein
VKKIDELSTEELAGLVCHTLREAGVTVTLTGGGCVTIWSRGKYVSYDLDFIEEGIVRRKTIRDALAPLGFQEKGRHFVHPRAKFFVEFPNGPLMVGAQRIEQVALRETSVGSLRLLSPTDSVKDRLAAFFHWNDRQSMEQAVLVAQAQTVDLEDIRRWAISEGHATKFRLFEAATRLPKTKPTRKSKAARSSNTKDKLKSRKHPRS